MSKPLPGLPSGDVPILGEQPKPKTVVMKTAHGLIAYPVVMVDGIENDVLENIAERVAKKLMPQIEALFKPAASG